MSGTFHGVKETDINLWVYQNIWHNRITPTQIFLHTGWQTLPQPKQGNPHQPKTCLKCSKEHAFSKFIKFDLQIRGSPNFQTSEIAPETWPRAALGAWTACPTSMRSRSPPSTSSESWLDSSRRSSPRTWFWCNGKFRIPVTGGSL